MSGLGTGMQQTRGIRRSFAERLLAAIKLDASVYEEVEHDASAMGQAVTVIALASLAQGLGAAGHGWAARIVGGVLGGFVGWLVGTAVIWLIGVKLMKHTSDYQELLRTLAFASAPYFLMALGVLPIGPLRDLLAVGVGLFVLIAFVIAVRQALDVSTGRAVLVCVLAMVAQMAVLFALLGLFVGTAGVVPPGVPAPTG